MKISLKPYITNIFTISVSLAFWIFSIIVISVFRSQYSWAEIVNAPDGYTGFWTSPTKFALLIPLFISFAAFFSILTVQLLLNRKIKNGIVDHLKAMRLVPRIITYALLLVTVSVLGYLEYMNISLVYVVWKGQYQSLWNTRTVSAAMALCTLLLVITLYALAVLVKSQSKKVKLERPDIRV
jgi:hypothetical protein